MSENKSRKTRKMLKNFYRNGEIFQYLIEVHYILLLNFLDKVYERPEILSVREIRRIQGLLGLFI